MSFRDELEAIHRDFQNSAPDEAAMFDADTEILLQRGVGKQALGIDDKAPDFSLPDTFGKMVDSKDLISKGPLVLNFYRGSWCPYCSLELRLLQQYLTEIENSGANMVAISPQLPDESLNTAEKNALTHPVLSDVGNHVARQYGLVFTLSEHLRPIYAKLGIDIPKHNGDDSFELPVPGTFVLDGSGIVHAAYVNADYKQRMDPMQILEALFGIR
jgi:peroxiredoxin